MPRRRAHRRSRPPPPTSAIRPYRHARRKPQPPNASRPPRPTSSPPRREIAIVDRLLAGQRSQVAERQGPVVRLIAALQSMARRPAVLGLIQPGSTEDMVHVRAVLGTTMPVVERRTAEVRAELARVQQLRANAGTAVKSLRDGRARLEAERIGLVRLEAEHRARSQELGRSALVESDRALALGERAREIVDQMETQGEAEQIQGALLALPARCRAPMPNPRRRLRSGWRPIACR
ncbi:hypothetical protein PIB19_13760 [Sphingomonas sp. 7/4-4]|uniref:hypothetical protein n=1 Tax=Sphingomonas sp. 7/4-4 TaxID=3018446 RepID=UPI0022F380FA|nr:hypothetical protein [Sphingomonas sp. 7/4-4]WBY06622.1 hypothetical protein PIB19_13760 [Sphingomonas sp. 7/4-4]